MKYSKYNPRTISTESTFLVSNTCNFCGTHQTTATAFAALIRQKNPDPAIQTDSAELSMFEIVVCQKCFHKNFNDDYNLLIKSHHDME